LKPHFQVARLELRIRRLEGAHAGSSSGAEAAAAALQV
jgi:hypothetical protein